MKKNIDCMIIGQNQLLFDEYEKTVRKMGVESGAYRDLDKNTLWLDNRLRSGADIFNLFCAGKAGPSGIIEPIKPVETFSSAIAYLGTYLHRRGFTFDFIDDFQKEKDRLAEALEQGNISAVAVTTTLYVAVFPILEIMDFIRKHHKTVPVIVGGPFIATKTRSLNPAELAYLFESIGADYYVNSSQGEMTLTHLLHAIKTNTPADTIKNIYYKTPGGFVAAPTERENNPLEENMVDWSLFADRVGPFPNLRTGISCPFTCAFCGFPEHAGKYQVAPVEAVEKELNSLARIPSIKSITFTDDTFNIPPERFKDLLRMMIKNRYSFRWNSFYRCQYADEETVRLMKESNVESVFLGLESGSDDILKNMDKKATVDQFLRGMELLNKYEITTFGNFIVGFPGETQETVRDTMEFIKKINLDFFRAQLWYCELITPIWRQREKYGLKGESFEWSHNTMNSQQACDLIEESILSLEGQTRLIQYYFDYDNVTQLTHKGMTLQAVKNFLKAFDKGVKEKIKNPARKEVGYDVIRQIIDACCGKPGTGAIADKPKKIETIASSAVEFDF